MIDTSSFFWLGLVAAVIIGLFLTIIHTRNGRLAAAGTATLSRLQEPLQIPKLWDIYIDPNNSDEDTLTQGWKIDVPLSLTVMRTPEALVPPDSPSPASVNTSLFSRIRRTPSSFGRATQKSKEQIMSVDALLSTVVLFPGLQSHEFAIATVATMYASESHDTLPS